MSQNIQLRDFDALALRVASPEVIHDWSYGEITKPETINYRTQKPEKTGLFAEEIFGPTKDWECYCGKYKKIRYKGIVCDKCGVEVTHSLVRRERMGHIELAAPVTHIWFLRSIPSKIGLILDLSIQALEKVIYFASFIITAVDQEEKESIHAELKDEYKTKSKQISKGYQKRIDELVKSGAAEKEREALGVERDEKLAELKEDYDLAEGELKDISVMNIISEVRYQELAYRYGHLFEAQIGGGAVRRLLEKLDLPKTIERLEEELLKSKGAKRERLIRRTKLIKSFHKNDIRPEWMVLTAIPVIPPDLRPMVALDGGRFATSDLNDLYRRVINRNNRLKRLISLNAPEVICRNEKRMLQEAVDALIDNNARSSKTVTASTGQKRQLRSLADILKGKQGRFRQNLLGKRVDYSGRSVIVVGPNMGMHECGLPKRMALELFKPFVMAEIIKRELAHNVRSASRFIETNAPEVWDILEELTQKTRVLLNRAPTLHRLGIQAFRPRLVEGKAIRLHPLVCPAFNADFDGDQMAVHLPLTEEAKWEAENLMAAEKNILKPATGRPVATPQQDIALGCFYLTKMAEEEGDATQIFSSPKEAKFAYKTRKINLNEKIKVRFTDLSKFEVGEGPIIETSVGRVFFNEIFPNAIAYYNQAVTKKHLGQIISFLLEFCGQEQTSLMLDSMKALGFKYVTKSGYSLGMDDFGHIEAKKALIQEGDDKMLMVEEQFQEGLLTESERHAKVLEIWTDIKDRVVSHNKEVIDKDGPVFAMIDSGARGSWGQLGQVIGMKGLVASPTGEIIELPVKGNFKEGFDVLEFFISSHGTRKGLSDTALRTANAGYLTRRLVDVAQDVVIKTDDCKDKVGEFVTLEQSNSMNKKLAERVSGRFVLADVVDTDGNVIVKKGKLITLELSRAIDKVEVKEVHVRSVLQCTLPKGVCAKCYGTDLSNNNIAQLGTAAGVIAAQSIGEPGTQLTMRTFHLGGVAGGGDITQGLPRVEELLEARKPKRKAVLAGVAGTVEIEDADGKIITSPTGRKVFEGRRGQKIIKIHFDGIDEMEIKMLKADDVKVEDGQKVKKDELLMVKGSSGEKIKAEYTGTVRFERRKLILSYEGRHTKEYIIPIGYKLWVKDGDEVIKGAQLSEGSVDLKELFELRGRDAVQRYILEEIQQIYSSQGQSLNDKHIEIIIKQMFSRMYVEDAGDTDLLPGEIVEKAQYIIANREMKASGGTPAKARELFLGISKVALSTQSFLSAASFQETSKVLINAAITGKVDYLEGLKENVIIGRLIPVGTGFGEER
ncbi:MAG: DNA-directed RNA polymerase subunit beta' [Candidatus Magasanikbacteria bacterium]|jgi:DNA-directed RNA polymerase subunit beta'|nr:DNA-directed RNA polymerase subunit beta' [Candidatus Magasanikbacteria bacterium]